MILDNGFTEISLTEMEEIDGGIGWAAVAGAALLITFVVCSCKGCADAGK